MTHRAVASPGGEPSAHAGPKPALTDGAWELLFRGSPAPMSLSRLVDGAFLEVSEPFLAMFGYARAEVIGRSSLELGLWVHADDRAAVRARLVEARSLRGVELRYRTRAGEVRLTANDIELVDVNGEECILAVYRDVTGSALPARAEGALDGAASRAVLGALVDGLVASDDRGTILVVNAAVERIFGYRAEELVGRNVSVLMPSPYREEHDGYVARYLRSSESHVLGVSREVKAQRRDGSTFPLELSVSEVRVGERRLFAAVMRDISERRRAERALWKYKARNQALINAMPDMLFCLNRDGVCLDFKAGKVHEPQLSPGAFLGRKVCDFYPPVLAIQALDHLERVLSTGEPERLEYQVLHDGAVHDYECRIVASGEDEALAIVRDITERKRADEALGRSQRDFRQLIELCPDGVVIHWQNRIRYVNRSFATSLGYDEGELIGSSLLDLVAPGEREVVAERILEQTEGRNLTPRETRYHRKDGKPLTLQIVPCASQVQFENGPGVLTITRDLSEHKKIEAQLYLADRLASVGTLAAGMAHEINNPLAYVTTNLRFVGEELASLATMLPEERVCELQQAVRDAQEGAERMRRIVRHLKTFSGGDDESRGSVDVRRVLEAAINVAWNEIRHRARLVKEFAEVPPVEANESRLGQVFLNLVVNAAQAIPEGDAEKNVIRIVTRSDGETVFVEVHDSGAGIPAEIRDRLFDPFFTTKPVGVGTGLGLSICHGIVAGLGGDITFESEMGRGTTFRVALPATQLEALAARRVAAAALPARRGRILVVDDETMILVSLRRLLSQEHEVVALTSAREAFERIVAGERFDLILCDLMMPDMTGMDLHAELSRAAPRDAARMVFLTGGAFTPRARAFLEQVSNHRLEKPFDGQNLRLLVRDFIASSRA